MPSQKKFNWTHWLPLSQENWSEVQSLSEWNAHIYQSCTDSVFLDFESGPAPASWNLDPNPDPEFISFARLDSGKIRLADSIRRFSNPDPDPDPVWRWNIESWSSLYSFTKHIVQPDSSLKIRMLYNSNIYLSAKPLTRITWVERTSI